MRVTNKVYNELTNLIGDLIEYSGFGVEKHGDETEFIGHYLGIFQYGNIRAEILGWGDGDLTHKVFVDKKLVFDCWSYYDDWLEEEEMTEGYMSIVGDYEPGQWEERIKKLHLIYLCDASEGIQSKFPFIYVNANSKKGEQMDLAELDREFYV